MPGGPAMTDAKLRHGEIMTDSPGIDYIERDTNPASLLQIERWYNLRCREMSELCVVPGRGIAGLNR
jgi:hypothetical protein